MLVTLFAKAAKTEQVSEISVSTQTPFMKDADGNARLQLFDDEYTVQGIDYNTLHDYMNSVSFSTKTQAALTVNVIVEMIRIGQENDVEARVQADAKEIINMCRMLRNGVKP
jgi:hypothetical protein